MWSVRFGVWRKQWEVRSVKCGLWSVKCGVWSFSLECEERSVKCEVWSVRFGVWRKQWEVRSVECEVWSVECEVSVWSAKSAVWSVKCEVWSVKEAVRSVKCGLWSVKCGVWSLSLECEERSVKCEVWSVKCEVWSVKEAVRSVKCGVWSLKFGVRRVQCEVWSVKTLLRLSLKKSNGCRGKDTVGTGCLWTIGHLCLGNFRRRLARVYVIILLISCPCPIYLANSACLSYVDRAPPARRQRDLCPSEASRKFYDFFCGLSQEAIFPDALVIVEGSLEVKLPTIWRDEKAVSRAKSQKRKDQKKEDAGARKGRKVAKRCVFSWFCGSGGLKSRLAKAAGAETSGEMRDE